MPPVVEPVEPPIVPVVEVPPIVPVVPPPIVPVDEPVPVPVVPPIVSVPPVRLLRLLRDFLAERLCVVVPDVAEESVGEVVV